MRPTLVTALCMTVSLLSAACGPSSVSEREWMNIPPMDTTRTSQSFETRTDTVFAKGEKPEERTASRATDATRVQYTVQVGSFKTATHAATIQARARQRYHLPVVNDYDSQRRRYRVRIGFFDTNEEALQLCGKLKKEFPEDYKDAWVTQLNK
jgi:cell division protein FtsN